MEVTLIEELLKINNDEIKLLNDLNEKVLTDEIKKSGSIVSINKHQRFIKCDFEKKENGEIYYMVMGSSRHTIDEKAITLNEGEIIFINKNARHKIDKLTGNDAIIKISLDPIFKDVCVLENDFFVKFLISTLFFEDMQLNYLKIDISNIVSVKNIFENMIYSMVKHEEILEKTNIFYMNLIFEHIKNEYLKIRFSPDEKDIRTIVIVIKYIDENMRDGELKSISDQLLMNQYTLSRKIKKITGFTFKELLQTKKLDTALYLLNNTDMPITKISETIGYENTSYFHKIFKEKYNVSPKKYRD